MTALERTRPMQRVQSVVLVWLDHSIDKDTDDNKNTITKLRNVINVIDIFADENECMKYIRTIVDDKVFMIVSGALGQSLVPHIHDMSQLAAIFVFCKSESFHKQWAGRWPKIRGVFTKIDPICAFMKSIVSTYVENLISFTLISSKDSHWTQSLNCLDPSYMYTQIIKDILLKIKFTRKNIDEYVKYCREAYAGNIEALKDIQDFSDSYEPNKAILWYSRESFVHYMLDRALRLTDIEVILKIAFLISDLHNSITKLHNEQSSSELFGQFLTLYRGQVLSKSDFEKLSKEKGSLLAFTNFLSTSKDITVAQRFAMRSMRSDPTAVGIIYFISINVSEVTTPFASIKDISAFGDEYEVLFSMHTVFRVGDVTSMDNMPEVFRVTLSLTNDDDHELRSLTSHIMKESYPREEGWYRLGVFLRKMGHADQSLEIFNNLLDESNEENKNGSIYYNLAWVKYEKQEYKEALRLYKKTLDIWKNELHSNSANFAAIYNNVGLVYEKLGDYPKAVLYYERAIRIQQISLPKNHPDIAKTYGNIGNAYGQMNIHSKELEFHRKAFQIQKESLPDNHPDLAASYNNMGAAYESMCDYVQAYSCFKSAFNIGRISLPSNHPHLQIYKKHVKRMKTLLE